MYAEIIVEGKSKFTDTFYTYDVNNLNLCIGDRVIIPFGKKTIEGYVFDFKEETELDPSIIKGVISKCDDLCLTPEIIKTCIWMKSRYGIKYYDAINLFIPHGLIAKQGKEKEPYKDLKSNYVRPSALTSEQKNAVLMISKKIEDNERSIFLIHGVTSSGKTEVYMEAIEKALSLNKTAIMLVPEISLTRQTIERFSGRFGKDNIAVLHSKLTPRERYDEWERLRNGKAKIAIGARMAVFSPLENIGVIILDEEHEATYKADMSPKYDTLDVACKRLMSTNGTVILGSATPSVVSYERAKEGLYTLIELKERYNKTPLPTIEIVDMKKELKAGNSSIFSGRLFNLIKENLENDKQVILLQNRRGYSNYVNCIECGDVMKCPECQISLTYHKRENKMICHYCGKKYDTPKVCLKCGSKYLNYVGTGTEKVEESISSLFPNSSVARLDLDTTSNRKNLDKILKDFGDKKINILVGTQLISKGLDFDNVGLVGVVNSDVTLNIPDYRSTERTFQLLTQVAGRSGRGSEQGMVVIQTSEPQNFVYKTIQDYRYIDFFEHEKETRKYLDYPPFGDLIVANFTSNDEKIALDIAERAKVYMQNILKDESDRVFSPKISSNFKGKDSYRTYILIKCPKGKRNEYVYYLNEFSNILFNEKVKCNLNIDVNPYSSL